MSISFERIFITGYNGFVAPHLMAACATRYPSAQFIGLVHEPAATDNTTPLESAVSGEALPSVTEIAGDITDRAGIRNLLREFRPDMIFHLAAVSNVAVSWKDPADVLRINAGGFIELAESIRAEGLTPRIVVSGSGEQYGLVRPEENPVTEETLPRPINPYAISKVTQDLLAYQFHRAYGLDVVRARAFNHFGPGQSADFVIPSFARQIAQVEAGQREPQLHVGNLGAQRDFLPVEAVAQAYLALAERGRSGEAYNIGSGLPRSIESVLRMLVEAAGVEVDIRVDPERFRPVEVPVLSADISKIQRDTDWRPSASMDDALRATLNYWRMRVRAATHTAR